MRKKSRRPLSQVKTGKEEAEVCSLPYFSTSQGSTPTRKGSNCVDSLQICRARLYVAAFVRDRKVEIGRGGSREHKQN